MDEDDSNATALAVLGHFVLREAILTSTWSLRSPDRFCYDRFGEEEKRVSCHQIFQMSNNTWFKQLKTALVHSV